MDDTPCRRFFLQPAAAHHRQYEALRAVFVEALSQKEVAQRFGYSHAALRQLVHQFRTACASLSPPPFSSQLDRGGLPRGPRRGSRSRRKCQRLPTLAL